MDEEKSSPYHWCLEVRAHLESFSSWEAAAQWQLDKHFAKADHGASLLICFLALQWIEVSTLVIPHPLDRAVYNSKLRLKSHYLHLLPSLLPSEARSGRSLLHTLQEKQLIENIVKEESDGFTLHDSVLIPINFPIGASSLPFNHDQLRATILGFSSE